jgi:hypothetical protein
MKRQSKPVYLFLGSLTALGVAAFTTLCFNNKSALALLASSFYLLTNYPQQNN